MPKNLRFWSNVALIAAAHVAIIVGFIRWSSESKGASGPSVMWLNGGAGDGFVLEKKNPPTAKSPAPRKETKTESIRLPEVEEDRPFLASAPSEIQLPSKALVTPTPTPVHTPKPKPKETPTASPARTATPRPKPTPKPTPKSSPKKITLAKASPKPSAKPTPEKIEKEQTEIEPEKKEIAKAAPVKSDAIETEPKKSAATQTGAGKGTSPGTGGGRSGGSTREAQFGWYGSMLHDRFYSEWVQPTSVASAGTKNSVLVKLRIEKDGDVSSFQIVRPSGNAELDESVKAIANRVTKVEPLPEGLGKDEHYDVKINFELNSE
jgi:TonB family protein